MDHRISQRWPHFESGFVSRVDVSGGYDAGKNVNGAAAASGKPPWTPSACGWSSAGP
jgi:hypothetical protein